MRTRQAVAAAVTTVILMGATVACASDEAPSSPPPAVVTPSPTPTESSAARQERLDLKAAEKSYRTFRKEYRRVLAAGGADQPTALMRRTAGGPYLEELMGVLRSAKKLHARQQGSEQIAYVKVLTRRPTEVDLAVCEDGRNITISTSNKSYGNEGVRQLKLEVRKIGERWKVWDGKGTKVSSCD